MQFIRVILIVIVSLIVYSLAILVMIQPWFLVLFGVMAVGLAAKKGYTQLSAFGTARWADHEDLKAANMLDSWHGLIIGRIAVRLPKLPAVRALFNLRIRAAEACENFMAALFGSSATVRMANSVHTAIFAPTGVGKGVSIVVPHLLTCPESTVVFDPKGENYKLTAAHRERIFGQQIVVLDPFNIVTQNPDTFNPFDSIPDSPEAIDELRDLAAELVVKTGEERAALEPIR